MELRHLRYFIAVAEAENVSRAALKLHVSQPGLSRQVRDLEAELGFALFERGAKSVRLTEAGRVFLTEARAVLERLDAGVRAARSVATGERGELHVGYAPSPTARILPPALRAFQAEQPQVRVRLHDLSGEEMLAGLRAGQLQLALTVKPAAAKLRGLRFVDLAQEHLSFAVAPQHPLARRRVVGAAELRREPLIVYSRTEYPDYHDMLDEWFARAKIRPRIVEEHDSVTSIIAAVEAGVGAALLPETISCLAGTRLKLVRLAPPAKPAVIGAALPGQGRNPLADQFVRCAQTAVRSG